MSHVRTRPRRPVAAPAAARPRAGHPFALWVALVGTLEALLVGFATSRQLYGDSFYDLVAGREIAHHGFSHSDPWTFLGANRRWIDQQWLAHVIYYGTETVGGLRAVSILSALLVGAGVGILAAIMAGRGTAPLRVAVWAGLGGVVAEANAVVRAQSFAYVAFGIALALLLADWERPSRRRRVALVLTLLAWANLHGSVLAFVVVVVVSWGWRALEARRRSEHRQAARELGWVALACVASVTTPFGLGIAGYYESQLDNPVLRQNISEWHAATFGDPFEILFFVALAATIAACAHAARRRLPLALPLVVAAVWYAYSGLVAERAEVWFTFVAMIVISDVLTRREQMRARPAAYSLTRLAPRVAAPLVAIAACTFVAVMAVGPALAYKAVPRRAIDLAVTAAGPRGDLCPDDDTAPALEWRHPGTRGRIAFDARYELYSQEQLRQIFAVLDDAHPTLPGWAQRCDVFVVDLHGSSRAGLARTVRQLPGARVVYDRPKVALVVLRPH